MANKRRPTSELNHDNWNEEDEPEEAGTFQKAPEDVLKHRIVKAARRRMNQSEDGPTRSAFGSFTGFKTTSTANTSTPFSFLKANTNSNTLTSSTAASLSTKKTEWNGSVKVSENGTNSTLTSPVTSSLTSTQKVGSTDKESSSPSKPAEYYAKLKGLNQSVAQWIKTHVDSNPVCILTPIFRDYEKYLKEIEQKHGKTTESPKVVENKPEVKVELPKPTESAKPVFSEEKKSTNFIFGSSSSKPVPEGQSVFGNTSDSSKSIFSSSFKSDNKSPFGITSSGSSAKSIFSPQSSLQTKEDGEPTKAEEKPTISSAFPQTTTSTGLFSFGQSSSTTSTASAGFSFGSGKPFTFGVAAVAKPQDSEDKKTTEEKEDDDEPPKPDFKPVTEEGSIFEQRCKVYVKKDGKYSDRGVGTLFLKPAPNDKMQLIVRAVNSLGNILLNTLLTESVPVQKANKNNIMLVCLPLPTAEPPPVPILLRVKTEEEADTLLDNLLKHKK